MNSRAFLITPFSAERAGHEDPKVFAMVQSAIRNAVDAVGVNLIHPAEMSEAGVIMEQVELQIGKADFVIAILTGLNPNVMLELGLAKKQPAILIVDATDTLPFDL